MLPRISWNPLRYINSAIDGGWPPINRWLVQAKELGLEYVEIYHHLLPSKDLAAARSLRRLLDRLELGVSMLTCAPDFTHPDEAVREREFEGMLHSLRLAKELGAAGVRVTAGCEYPEVPTEVGLRWAADYLARLGEQAERIGVKLGLENHYRDRRWVNNDFAFRTEVFLQLYELIKDAAVGINFDASNQLMVGDDPMVVLEVVADKVWHMHASDRQPGRYAHSVIGEGAVDFDAIFSFLARRGYAGFISLEDGNAEGDSGTRRALEFVRRKVVQWWVFGGATAQGC